jgi:hypothetical protein
MALTYTRYYDDKIVAGGEAQDAKDRLGMNVAILGPVKQIRRPKIGGGLENWPNEEDKDFYVVVFTQSEMERL